MPTDKPKSIAIFVTAEGTATSFLTGFVKHLVTEGWTVEVIARSEGKLEEWARRCGVDVHSIEMFREPAPWADLKALVHASRHLARTKPDVVVTATPKASLIGMLASALVGIRSRIYLAWGLRAETTRGFMRVIYLALERLTVSLSTRCLANSRSLAARMESLHASPRHRVKVPGQGSSHGVDLDYFNPEYRGEVDPQTADFLNQSDLPVGVFIGRLTEDKGLDALVQAIQKCSESENPIRLLVVGPDEGWSCPSGLTDLIWQAGSTSDVRPYLAQGDFLCLPSRREGFPNVVLEAAAMAVPAIVSDATGAVDSVVHEETGLVFHVDDSDELAHQMQRLVGDRELIARLGSAARARVERSFAQEVVWQLYAQEFDQELARRQSSRRKNR